MAHPIVDDVVRLSRAAVPAVRCGDCFVRAATFTIFTGQRFIEACDVCAMTRAQAPAPRWQLPGDNWICGRAAVTNRVFQPRNVAGEPVGTLQMWRAGCFRRSLPGRSIGLTANHGACSCDRAAPDEGLDPTRLWASTHTHTLWVCEDPTGLFFVARLLPDAGLQCDDAAPINVLDAIAAGLCAGVSLHAHGGSRESGTAFAAAVLVWADVRVQELSLLLPPFAHAGSPGTWAACANDDAMQRLYTELRATAATLE
jgi:hypothetical protein